MPGTGLSRQGLTGCRPALDHAFMHESRSVATSRFSRCDAITHESRPHARDRLPCQAGSNTGMPPKENGEDRTRPPR